MLMPALRRMLARELISSFVSSLSFSTNRVLTQQRSERSAHAFHSGACRSRNWPTPSPSATTTERRMRAVVGPSGGGRSCDVTPFQRRAVGRFRRQKPRNGQADAHSTLLLALWRPVAGHQRPGAWRQLPSAPPVRTAPRGPAVSLQSCCATTIITSESHASSAL
jgi:hypothetical protein